MSHDYPLFFRGEWFLTSEMAQNGNDREEDLKIVENLRIKIAECRDLPSRIGGSRIKEVYCSVRLDQTELYRSGTALKSDP